MSLKVICIILSLLISYSAARQLIPDGTNPLQIPDPRNNINEQSLVFRFRFPTASAGITGPIGFASPGLAYKQFFGVALPPTIAAELLLEAGNSPKWSCALTDGVNTYMITAVKSVASPGTSLTAENNIVYCRLDEIAPYAPLRTNLGSNLITYALTIKFTGTTKIASNFLRTVGFFTATGNHAEKMIIDSSPVFGTLAIYGDYTTSKILDVTANLISVISEPSLSAKSSVIYPTNSFDLTLTIKSYGFITAADHMIVLKFVDKHVSLNAPSIFSDSANTANSTDALQVALKGTLSLKAFGTAAYYINGIAEDIIPDRTFKITIKGWKALDLPFAQSPVHLIVYYKNTYSVVSYLNYPLISITKDTSTLTANHPESWDVYRGGAWPIAFTFKTTTDLANGGWVVIQHTNYSVSSATAGNQVTFIPSTCDFSDNEASLMDQGFGKRNNCYPLRTLDNTYTGSNGSGFFFYVKGPIALKNIYKVTVWAFFDVCGGSNDASMNILGASFTTQPAFTVNIYNRIDPIKLNEKRFDTVAKTTDQINIISSSNAVTLGQSCWNNFVTQSTAGPGDIWSSATFNKHTVRFNSATTDNHIAFLAYKEISEWFIFSETQDNHTNATAGNWYASPKTEFSSTTQGIKFLYSAINSNIIASGSFFLVGFEIGPSPLSIQRGYMKLPLPLVNGPVPPTMTMVLAFNAPGRFQWQVPAKWFTAGNSYKSASNGNCYCSWFLNRPNYTDIQVSDQVLATLKDNKLDYSLNNVKNNHYFGAGGMNGSAVVPNQIEESKSYAGGDTTKTGKDAILRITSVYHNGDALQVWRFGDPTKIFSLTTEKINVGLFSSCFKWVSALPSITSLYSAIDIHIKWNYISSATSNPAPETNTGDGRPIMVWRLIKLFPETGVFNDWSKNSGSGILNPFVSHTVYSTPFQDGVCLIELSASIIGPLRDTASNTLILWIFGGSILETDYSDVSSVYPMAPLNSAITAYGTQTGYTIDLNNPYAKFDQNPANYKIPIIEQLTEVNTTPPLSVANASLLAWQAPSKYFFFMGSSLFLTNINSNFLTSASNNSNNILIPYYCPRFPTNYMTPSPFYQALISTESLINQALPFPLAMAAYFNMSAYNSISSLNTWVQFSGSGSGAKRNIKVLTTRYLNAINQSSSKTNAVFYGLIPQSSNMSGVPLAVNTFFATLKWTPYSTTDTTQNNLYIYNGMVSAANTSQICTGHALFIAPSLTVSAGTTPAYSGLTPENGVTGYFNGNKQFYVFGRVFQKGLFYGLGPATLPTTANMTGTIADGSVPSNFFITNIKRPNVDSFFVKEYLGVNFLLDRVAYFCVPLNSNLNTMVTNYLPNPYSTNGVGSFHLDWYRNISTPWATQSEITFDKVDVYKSDPATNFRVNLNPPAAVPFGTNLRFTTGPIMQNAICGIIANNEYSKLVSAHACTVSRVANTTNYLVSCNAPATFNSFTVCCYNVALTDPIALSSITANFNNDPVLGTVMTSNVYINPTASNNFFSLSSPNTTINILSNKSAIISNVFYSQTLQELGIGKVTFAIDLPREPIPNMRVTITSPDLSGILIPDVTPRCLATFASNNIYGSNLDNGDILIETCSSNNLKSTPGTIVVTTKSMIYKCGTQFNKTLYVNLWPVIAVNWTNSQVINFKVNLTLGNTETSIAFNKSEVSWNISPPLNNYKPLVLGQWDTLCAVSSITPRIPGELADWTFDIDLVTSQIVLASTTPNEITLFFPYSHFGSNISNLLCYIGKTILNCSFTDESTLNIRFKADTLEIGKKIQIVLVGVRNPALDNDISIPCTINSSDFSTGVRKINIIGSGKLSGGINLNSVTNNGAIRLLRVSNAVSNKNPRYTSTHTFRMTFDYATGLTNASNLIDNLIFHIYFPEEYALYLSMAFSAPKVIIQEYTSDSFMNTIAMTSTYTPASSVSGNRIMIIFSEANISLNTFFRYWDIIISDVPNPADWTIRFSLPVTSTTRPFNMLLHSRDLKSVFRTFTNTNSYSSEALMFPVDANLSWNRGIYFIYDFTKWVLDVYTDVNTLNSVVLNAGRYAKAFINAKQFPSFILPSVNTIFLTDNLFKFAANSYKYATVSNEPMPILIGAPCGTAPGVYMINLTITDEKNFAPMAPITVHVNTNTKAEIWFHTAAAVAANGSAIVQFFMSEVNFDALKMEWSVFEGARNDPSSLLTNTIIPPATMIPLSYSANHRSPVFSTFSISSIATILPPQAYKIADPNSCYTFRSNSSLNINISASVKFDLNTIDLKNSFKYFNSDTDSTINAKNSLKFTFTPPIAPLYMFCALACINSSFPEDEDIIIPKVAPTIYMQFFNNFISTTSSVDLMFNNLVRGMKYKIRCIVKSTETAVNQRSSASITIENFPATLTTTINGSRNNNSTSVVNISPPISVPTQCAVWHFLKYPDVTAVGGLVNTCQKIFTLEGYSTNGCVTCTLQDLSYVVNGADLPNKITCPSSNARTRLRFLQAVATGNSTDTNSTSAATNSTQEPSLWDRLGLPSEAEMKAAYDAFIPSTLVFQVTVCPVPHPVCATDATPGKTYNDYFIQFIDSLKTPSLFKTNLGISGILMRAENPILNITDATAPDVTNLKVYIIPDYISMLYGYVKWLSTNPTPVFCTWIITDSVVTPSYDELFSCTDTFRCGKSRINIFPLRFNNVNTKLFYPGQTYQIYMSCLNDIPFAVKYSDIVQVSSFTVPAPITLILSELNSYEKTHNIYNNLTSMNITAHGSSDIIRILNLSSVSIIFFLFILEFIF